MTIKTLYKCDICGIETSRPECWIHLEGEILFTIEKDTKFKVVDICGRECFLKWVEQFVKHIFEHECINLAMDEIVDGILRRKYVVEEDS